MSKSTIFIGDVHGQAEALSHIVDWAGDRFLIFCGDLVHKGPDPKGVVDQVRSLVGDGRAWAVKGNHDHTVGTGGGASQEWGLDEEDREWLKSLPLFVRREGVVALHGGLDETTLAIIQSLRVTGRLPEGDWSPSWVEWALERLPPFEKDRLTEVLPCCRFVDSEGNHLRDEDAQYGVHRHWAQWYGGWLGHVCFGHQPWEWSARFPHATGLDTGAGETSRLSYGRLSPLTCGVDEVLVHPRGLFAQEFKGGKRTDWCAIRTSSTTSIREDLERATPAQAKELSMEVAYLQQEGKWISQEILDLLKAKM